MISSHRVKLYSKDVLPGQRFSKISHASVAESCGIQPLGRIKAQVCSVVMQCINISLVRTIRDSRGLSNRCFVFEKQSEHQLFGNDQ